MRDTGSQNVLDLIWVNLRKPITPLLLGCIDVDVPHVLVSNVHCTQSCASRPRPEYVWSATQSLHESSEPQDEVRDVEAYTVLVTAKRVKDHGFTLHFPGRSCELSK